MPTPRSKVAVLVALVSVSVAIGCNNSCGGSPCAPGDSQVCTGPGGCSGVQLCLPDGSAFGSCVCDADGGQDAGPFTISFGPVSVGTGIEQTQCITKRLGNPNQFHVASVHSVITGTWDELVVSRVDDPNESLSPTSCAALGGVFLPDAGVPLIFTKSADEVLQLPPGAGFTLAANQMLRLELHMFNPTGTAEPHGAEITFSAYSDGGYANEAALFLVGAADISAAAMAITTTSATVTLGAGLNGAQAFQAAGFTHQLGTDVTASTNSATFYAPGSFSWSPPTIAALSPVTTFGPTVALSCSWNNNTASPASYGTSANAEVCFLRTYYSPRANDAVCIYASALTVCCPSAGSSLCSSLLQ